MRNILLSIMILGSIHISGCRSNTSADDLKNITGIQLSEKKLQEFGSCDSTIIDQIAHDSTFLLFRIPPNACSSCYNREISIMRDFFDNKKMPIIISSFNSCRNFLVFGSNYKLDSEKLYNASLLLKRLDDQSIPYYLRLDSSNTIIDAFMTDKTNHTRLNNFLSKHSSSEFTKIKLNKKTINLDKIKQGTTKTVNFSFKNIGDDNFIIHKIKASCGCTETNWPKHPIAPNKSGKISVTYSSKTPGKFNKTIHVFCNSKKNRIKLFLTGEIIE